MIPKRSMAKLAPIAIATIAIFAGVSVVTGAATSSAASAAHYVDCSAPSNGDGAITSPWNNISSVNAATLGAGDSVLFKSGTRCTGQLTPKGSGTAGSPITMTSYGTGAQPIIDAAGTTGAVIKLLNQQYWEFSGLELRNQSSTADYRQGILAENSSGTTLHHIKITKMTIDNISGWAGGWYSTNTGVGIQTDHTTPNASTWDDITISGNTFSQVDRIAIAVTPDKDGEGTGLTTNVVIANNNISFSGGDDILIVKGQGAVISGNTTSSGGSKSYGGCPPTGQYCNQPSASIWMAGSTGTTVRNNSVTCFTNQGDGEAYDVDWGNHDTTVEYNYSRNNSGGFLLVMDPINVTNEPTSQIPSDGIVVRYNISESDTDTAGCPLHVSSKFAHSIINFLSNIPNQSGSAEATPLFYNNTLFIPASVSGNVLGSYTTSTPSGSLLFDNNVVENFGSSGYFTTTASTFANNLFYGNHSTSEPAGTGTMTLDPAFVGPLPTSSTSSGPSAFHLSASSPAVAAGTPLTNNGGVDFAGNGIAAVPTIGAFEGSNNLLTNGGFESGALAPWYSSGPGAAITTGSTAQGADAVVTAASGSGVNQNVTGLVAGVTYQLTGWTKIAPSGGSIAVGVKNFGGTETYALSTATAWAPLTVYFTMGSSSTSATVYCWKNSGGTGVGYCDSMSLQRVTNPVNLVSNPGFESGQLNPWVVSGTAAPAVSATAANTGTYGLLTAAANSGANQTITGLTPGGTYVLTGWLRASSGEDIALGVKTFGGHETYQSVASTTYASATVVFTIGTNSTSATVYCWKGGGSSPSSCDDIRLTPLG